MVVVVCVPARRLWRLAAPGGNCGNCGNCGAWRRLRRLRQLLAPAAPACRRLPAPAGACRAAISNEIICTGHIIPE